jgi:hypothetical protein
MYYLIVELPHLTQISRLEPGMSRDILRGIESCCQRNGMQRYPGYDGQLYYHPDLGPGEYEPLVKTMFGLEDLLKRQADELMGYNIIVEALDTGDVLAGDFLKLRLRSRERNGIFLGPGAEKLISRFLVGESFRGLWKVFSRKQKSDENLGTATEFVLRKRFVDPLFDSLEGWMNGENPPGLITVKGTEYDGIHLVARGISQRLATLDSHGKMPYVVVHDREHWFFSLTSAINFRQGDWVEDHLGTLDRRLWRNKADVMRRLHPRVPRKSGSLEALPELIESDLLLAIQMYLRAYARWSRDNGNLPLVILHLERPLEKTEIRFLSRVMEDGRKDSRLFWLITGNQETIPAEELPLERIDFALETYNEEELSELPALVPGEHDNSGYILNVTEGHALPVYQYLGDVSYFSGLLPSRLRNYGNTVISSAEGILHRYLDRIDFDTRELLFCLSIAGDILDKEHMFSFMEGRGRLRTRITEMFKELQTRGLLVFEQLNHVVFRETVDRMAYALGDVRSAVIEDLLSFIIDDANDVNPSPGCLRFVSRHARQSAAVRWLYRQIQLYIESRHFELATDLLSVFAGIREGRSAERLLSLRIAAEEGRARAEEADASLFPEGFWAAEARLLRSRILTRRREYAEARNEAKAAIIGFQNLGDQRGIGSANIQFGYLLLCEARHQDSTHYFSIGERSSAGGAFDVNRILSGLFPALSDFSQGRLSRVRTVLEGDEGFVRELYRRGFRSYSAAAAFLLARTYFAMGLFDESYSLLSSMLNVLHGEEFIDLRRIFYGWMGRNLVYLEHYQAGMNILENLPRSLETQVFTAEAHLIRKEYENALSVLDAGGELPDYSYRVSSLLPWNSGFSWIEDLYIRDIDSDGALRNYAWAIRAFCMGNIDRSREAIELFHWLTREKKIPPSDPHNSVILFWYSLILERGGDSENEDRLTLLGRAVKALQERSSRIDEPADKREYLKNVVWNRELLDKAKRFNLV